MSKSGALKGWHVLAILLAFFGLIMGVNGLFVAEALRSFPGEDEAKSYAQGLRYNETLRDRHAQAALGWHAEADFTGDGNQIARVTIRLSASDGKPIKGARIVATLRRPTDARLDRPLRFYEASDGEYAASADALQAGQWALHARAERGGDHFDVQRTMLWRTPKP